MGPVGGGPFFEDSPVRISMILGNELVARMGDETGYLQLSNPVWLSVISGNVDSGRLNLDLRSLGKLTFKPREYIKLRFKGGKG